MARKTSQGLLGNVFKKIFRKRKKSPPLLNSPHPYERGGNRRGREKSVVGKKVNFKVKLG